MFTDMVGYTALGQKSESLSLALVDEQRRLTRPILKRHEGREVKTIGDAFLVEFSSALEAVRCAYEIQRATREFNIPLPEERRIHLRVGIHLGDVVESAGDISGDAVNLASRIEALAENGGVCLTRQVYDHVQNKFELPLKSVGNKVLKNVAFPVEVFSMVMPWSEEKQEARGKLDRNRLAVLPLSNMSSSPEDGYFADGMTEELISSLSRLPGLGVISRTSVMQYKNQAKHASEIGRELGAGTLLEGSVRKAGNRVRIALQLIDTNTDNHLWAENYDRNLDDVFAIQSDVASRVSASLKAGGFAGPVHPDTDDMEAYTIYLRAIQLSYESTEPALKEAVSLLIDVVSRDPSFVRARVGLVLSYVRMANQGYAEFTVLKDKAEVEARKAIELDPSSADAHAALSVTLQYLDEFKESVEEAEKAIQINPNAAEAYFALGFTHCTEGRIEQGLSYFWKALELDPLSVQKARILANALGIVGKGEEARTMLNKMRRIYPENPTVYLSLAESYILDKDFPKAQELIDKGQALNPIEPLLLINQGLLYAYTGRPEQARAMLRKLESLQRETPLTYSQIFIHTALGEIDEAFKALNKASETHVWPFTIKTHPLFAGLRKDPRFADFCRKMGIPN
jgi:TolB-like protein/tetratricopeptide (TPR) repeat protein